MLTTLNLKGRTLLTTAAIAAIAFASAAPLSAQESATPSSSQGQMEQSSTYEVTPDKLEAFVEAQEDAREIQQKYSTQATDATPEESAEIQSEMNAEIVESIENAGLEVNEFQMIVAQLQTNPQLQQQYSEMSK